MVVIALVGGDDDGKVIGGTLHPLLHLATNRGATIVAPVLVHLREKNQHPNQEKDNNNNNNRMRVKNE